MTFNQYLTNDYNELIKASHKITGNNDLALDLLHYAIIEMSNKSNIQDIVDSGGARFYCVCIMSTQWRSKTGPFYKSFVKSNVTIEDKDWVSQDEPEIDVVRITALLNELNWYDRQLFMLYTDGCHSYSSLARETGIPRTSIGLTINRIKKYIKKNL